MAYWFQYVYHRNCEREATNFAVLSPTVVEVVSSTTTNKSELSEIKDLLQNLLNGNNNLQLAGNTVSPSSQKVGFTFGLQKDAENKDSDNRIAKIAVNENGMPSNGMPSSGVPPNRIIEGNRICKHCGEAYIYKHHKQQYCTKECRDTAWEQRTGKKLIFRKGSTK